MYQNNEDTVHKVGNIVVESLTGIVGTFFNKKYVVLEEDEVYVKICYLSVYNQSNFLELAPKIYSTQWIFKNAYKNSLISYFRVEGTTDVELFKTLFLKEE